MLHTLRRHRLRLARLFAGLLVLAWTTLALQPCIAAPTIPPPPPVLEHHHHDGQAGMEVAFTHHAPESQEPCAPNTDCPVFKAVDGQAATKGAEKLDLPTASVPMSWAHWPQPLFTTTTPATFRVARVVLPAPPILEFRVLLI